MAAMQQSSEDECPDCRRECVKRYRVITKVFTWSASWLQGRWCKVYELSSIWCFGCLGILGGSIWWHCVLFHALCLQVQADFIEMKQNYVDLSECSRPLVIIVMPLTRTATPMQYLSDELFVDERGLVAVSLPMSIQGESFQMVHVVRHRRTLHCADQYNGIQSNFREPGWRQ